ncbi:unnamed protein product [Trifolium pratense]|uniref:Uncharacterized protein n=1 Tax=Trifolium pratense TaxID=57577 RepID=A0ACB0LMA0_TRIPR|nr:unnamed protein product [Trifolium pratense]
MRGVALSTTVSKITGGGFVVVLVGRVFPCSGKVCAGACGGLLSRLFCSV